MASDGEARRVAVLGGGITGLAAAYELANARRAGAPVEELLIEASARLGGVIRTERREGFVIEGGPDSFLTEKPDAAQLARELGLGQALVGSNDGERRTYILHRGRLVPLPDGLMLMVPTRFWPALTSRLIPFSGKVAAVMDWFRRPRTSPDRSQDESVATFVRRHFGDGVLENIADPLLAGVYGGESGRLSVQATLPRLWEMEAKHGSLIRAALEARRRRDARLRGEASSRPEPLFTTLRDGLEQLVQGIVAALDPPRVLLGRKVAGLERRGQGRGGFILRAEGGASYEADAVIVALPAAEVARLLAPMEPAIEALGALPCSSGVTVSLAYGNEVRKLLPPGFGFLVPRKEKRRLLACTLVHTKFPGRAPEGKALVRCFLGGMRDGGAVRLGDEELVAIVRSELKDILKLNAQPLFGCVFRSPQAIPQYLVGHRERMRLIRERLCPERGIFLAGNAYAGIGISDCIRSGRTAARQAVQTMVKSSDVAAV
jgi:oxygen-dependent protoporphyrinogen oxidase